MSTNQKTRAQLLSDLLRAEQEMATINESLNSNKDVELNALVDEFKKSLEANRFNLQEVEHLLYPKIAQVAKPAQSQTASDATEKVKLAKNIKYRNPDDGETWISGKKGARPKWIAEALKKSTDISHLEVNEAESIDSTQE